MFEGRSLARGLDDVPYWVRKLIRNANFSDPGDSGSDSSAPTGEPGTGDPGTTSTGDPGNTNAATSPADAAAQAMGYPSAAAMDAALGPGAAAAAAGMGIGTNSAASNAAIGQTGNTGTNTAADTNTNTTTTADTGTTNTATTDTGTTNTNTAAPDTGVNYTGPPATVSGLGLGNFGANTGAGEFANLASQLGINDIGQLANSIATFGIGALTNSVGGTDPAALSPGTMAPGMNTGGFNTTPGNFTGQDPGFSQAPTGGGVVSPDAPPGSVSALGNAFADQALANLSGGGGNPQANNDPMTPTTVTTVPGNQAPGFGDFGVGGPPPDTGPPVTSVTGAGPGGNSALDNFNGNPGYAPGQGETETGGGDQPYDPGQIGTPGGPPSLLPGGPGFGDQTLGGMLPPDTGGVGNDPFGGGGGNDPFAPGGGGGSNSGNGGDNTGGTGGPGGGPNYVPNTGGNNGPNNPINNPNNGPGWNTDPGWRDPLRGNWSRSDFGSVFDNPNTNRDAFIDQTATLGNNGNNNNNTGNNNRSFTPLDQLNWQNGVWANPNAPQPLGMLGVNPVQAMAGTGVTGNVGGKAGAGR